LLDETDAPELYRLIELNRAYLAHWMPWAADQTLDGTLDFIRGIDRQVTDNDGFQAAIIGNDQIIGMVGYHAVGWSSRFTSIGYWLDQGHQGMGTMTAAVRLLVGQAFSVWELNRIEIRAATENHRSRAIAERLGFHQEGTLRQRELINGRYLDCVVYSMLSEDWRAGLPAQ
jgi:ribosomal-protein-serine acetyltransferase